MEIKITVKNYDQMYALFKKAPQKMVSETTNAIARSILAIENAIKREAPVNKQTAGGNLRQSIRSQMRGSHTGVIEAGAEYASAVETGTRPHEIRPRNKRALANTRTNQFFGKLVRHPGTVANPFFSRGVQKAQPQVDKFFLTAVENVLKS